MEKVPIRNRQNDRVFDLIKDDKHLYLDVKLKNGNKRILLSDVLYQIIKAIAA